MPYDVIENTKIRNRMVEVAGVSNSEEDGVIVTLSIINMANCNIVEVDLPWGILTPVVLERIIKKNGCFARDAKELHHQIEQEVKNCLYKNVRNRQVGLKSLIKNTYKDIGWAEKDGELVFRGSHIYSNSNDIEGIYNGERKIEPTGHIENLIKMFKKCIEGNTPMEVAVAIGVSATVLPYIKRNWGKDICNPINHIVGNSTTGKSTATSLIVSFGSAPTGENSNGLSYMSTTKALLKKMEGIKGYPIGIDEFSTLSRSDITAFVYELGNGQGRDTCSSNSKVKKGSGCETVIVSNGESSMLEKCNKNTGVRVRLIEFQAQMWTRDAEEARTIKEVVSKNYGLVTPLVAEILLKKGDDYRKDFDYWQERLAEEVKKAKVKLASVDRLSDILSMYMISGIIGNEIMHISMDLEKMFRFLFINMIIRVAEEADLGRTAYEVLLGHFAMHRDRYPELIGGYYGNYDPGIDKEGFIVDSEKGAEDCEGNKYTKLIAFYRPKLDQILRDAGFTSTKTALEDVREKGLLRCHDGNRLYSYFWVGSVQTKMYAIWAHVDPLEIPDSVVNGDDAI